MEDHTQAANLVTPEFPDPRVAPPQMEEVPSQEAPLSTTSTPSSTVTEEEHQALIAELATIKSTMAQIMGQAQKAAALLQTSSDSAAQAGVSPPGEPFPGRDGDAFIYCDLRVMTSEGELIHLKQTIPIPGLVHPKRYPDAVMKMDRALYDGVIDPTLAELTEFIQQRQDAAAQAASTLSGMTSPYGGFQQGPVFEPGIDFSAPPPG